MGSDSSLLSFSTRKWEFVFIGLMAVLVGILVSGPAVLNQNQQYIISQIESGQESRDKLFASLEKAIANNETADRKAEIATLKVILHNITLGLEKNRALLQEYIAAQNLTVTINDTDGGSSGTISSLNKHSVQVLP